MCYHVMCASCKINDSIIVEPPLGNKRYSQNKYIISLRWSFLWEMNAFADGDRWFPDGRPCPRILLNFYKDPFDILSRGQNIEIWYPRAKKPSISIYFCKGKSLSWETWSEYWNLALWAWSQENIDFHILYKGRPLSWEPWSEYWNMAS